MSALISRPDPHTIDDIGTVCLALLQHQLVLRMFLATNRQLTHYPPGLDDLRVLPNSHQAYGGGNSPEHNGPKYFFCHVAMTHTNVGKSIPSVLLTC